MPFFRSCVRTTPGLPLVAITGATDAVSASPNILATLRVMLPGKQSYKLIRNDLTLQGQVEDTNIAQYFFPFL